MYWSRIRPITRESSAERVRRRVADVAVWLWDGRRKANRLRRGGGVAGVGSLFVGTAWGEWFFWRRVIVVGGGGGLPLGEGGLGGVGQSAGGGLGGGAGE